MGKNLKYLITIILIIIYLAFSVYPNVKTFDEIALNYYKDKDFDEVRIIIQSPIIQIKNIVDIKYIRMR